jgi:histidyl-tRNA synthetase
VKADVAIVADDPMEAVIYAATLRRKGVSVATQFSGKFDKQMKRAINLGESIIIIRNGVVSPAPCRIMDRIFPC